MSIKFANNAVAKLQSNITSIQTNITVQAGQGQLFPYVTGGTDYFYVTLVDSSANREIVKVIDHQAGSPDGFTIVRGQDGTSASAYSAGDIFELRWVAAVLTDQQLSIDNAVSDLSTLDGDFTTHEGLVGSAAHGLGTISTQNANNVAITGGSVVPSDVAAGENKVVPVYISASSTPPTASSTVRGTLFIYYV